MSSLYGLVGQTPGKILAPKIWNSIVFIFVIGFSRTEPYQNFGTKNLEPSRNLIAKTFILVIRFSETVSLPKFGTKNLVSSGDVLDIE